MSLRSFLTVLITVCALGTGTQVLAQACCYKNNKCNSATSANDCKGGETYSSDCCALSPVPAACEGFCAGSYAPSDDEYSVQPTIARQLHSSHDRLQEERAFFEVGFVDLSGAK